MARLFTGGAELGHAQADGLLVAATVTIDTAVKRTGAASYKAAATNSYHTKSGYSGATGQTYFFRGYYYIPSLPTSPLRPFSVNQSIGTAILFLEMLNGSNVLRLTNSAGTVLATGTIPLAASTWYRIEFSFNIAAAGNSAFELRIDGATDFSGSYALGSIAPAIVRFGVTSGNIGGLAAVYHDDVALNDTLGSDQNSWPGAGAVYALVPVADPGTGTAATNWTKPAGATTNRFQSVDNSPPIYMADTTVVGDADKMLRNPTNAASQLELDVNDYTTGGVPSGETIVLVQPVAGTGSSSATDTTGSIECLSNPVVTAKALTTFDNAVASTTATTWPRASGEIAYNPSVTRGTQPRVRLSRAAAARTVMTNMVALIVETEPSSGTAWTQPVDDTLSLADSLASESGKAVTVPDTLALADATSFQGVFARQIDDTLSLTDALAQAEEIHIGDTLALADLCDPVKSVGGVAHSQPVDDTLSLADATTAALGIERSIPDTLSLADAQSLARAIAQAIPDTLALSDAQALVRTIASQIDDTLTLADATALVRGIAQAIPDTLSLSDSATTAAGKGASIDDTLALADGQVFDRGLTIPETVALTDTLAQAEEIHISDTLSLADLATPELVVGGSGKTASIDDTLALADAQSFARTIASQVDDTVSLADALTSQAALVRALADTVSPGDGLSALELGRALSLADTASLSDGLLFVFARGLQLADTLSLADALAFQAVLLRSLADTLSLSDLVTTLVQGTPSEAFPGEFDPGTEEDANYEPALAGRSRGRGSSAGFTSTQRGKIGVS